MTSRVLHWVIAGKDLTVHIEESKGQGTFHIADRSIPFRLLERSTIEIDGRRTRFHVIRNGDSYTVWLRGRTFHLKRGVAQPTAVTSTTGEIAALMPGKVLRLEVSVGDAVSEKQIVAIMESMKMESALYASRAGRIAEIRCEPGQIVEMGQVLMVIG